MMCSVEIDELGRELRARRAAAGRTISSVASDAGLSVPYIANLENGRGNPTLAALVRLSRALGAELRVDLAPPAETGGEQLPASLIAFARTRRFAEEAGRLAASSSRAPATSQPAASGQTPGAGQPLAAGGQTSGAGQPLAARGQARAASGRPPAAAETPDEAQARHRLLHALATMGALSPRPLTDLDWHRLLDALTLISRAESPAAAD
jgi:transcriptional regulator with XRE-family HTH domain